MGGQSENAMASISRLSVTEPGEPSFEDRQDFEDAKRGKLISKESCIIHSDKFPDQVIWNNDAYTFLSLKDSSSTVNDSLWRQGQLTWQQGLYQVSDHVFQVRGFDISNMSIIQTTSQNGIIIVDP